MEASLFIIFHLAFPNLLSPVKTVVITEQTFLKMSLNSNSLLDDKAFCPINYLSVRLHKVDRGIIDTVKLKAKYSRGKRQTAIY